MATTAFNGAVDVTNLTVYSDGSGAPALVTVAGHGFACDYIGGKVSITCVRPQHGSRRQSEVAATRCRAAYGMAVLANTSAEWRASNLAMYADVAE